MTGKVLTPAEVASWLIERRDNCTRIAASKVGTDKVGWVEDAAYFQAAIQACTDNARLRGLIEGMECQVWCAKYDYFGVSCEKCGVGEVHARGPLCPEDGVPHSWITVAQKPCNCVKSQVNL